MDRILQTRLQEKLDQLKKAVSTRSKRTSKYLLF